MEHPLVASVRQTWLSKLELTDKVKGSLLSAIVQNDDATAIELLKSGQAAKKDIRARAAKLPTGLTALHLAALFGDNEVLKKLVELSADTQVTVYCQILTHSIHNQLWFDARPLLFAVGAKNLGTTEILLQNGASVDMNDAWPLYSSEWWQLTERFDWDQAQQILKVLIQNGLDVNHRVAKLKWTMLHYCVNIEPRVWSADAEDFLTQRYNAMEHLLQSGADALIKDTFGRTSFKLVEERSTTIPRAGHTEAEMKELTSLRADADERLKELLQKAMIDRVDAIKSKGGFKGSFQRFVVTSQALDRIPLLGNHISSIRRSSMSSYGQQSQASATA